MSKYLRFDKHDPSPNRKTDRWDVLNKHDDILLGTISWFPAWRKYCFAPLEGTIFEEDCLRDIAAFIEDQTKHHK